MNEDYSELSYEELREKLLNGELEAEKMSQADYECLFQNEIALNTTTLESATVLDYCVAGLKSFDEYKGRNDFEIYGSAVSGQIKSDREFWSNVYKDEEVPKAEAQAAYGEFCNKLINCDQKIVKECVYKFVYDHEMTLAEPNAAVVNCCTVGLKRYKTARSRVKLKRLLIIAAATIATLTLLGLGFYAYFNSDLFNSSQRTAVDLTNDNLAWFDNCRVYDSAEELFNSNEYTVLYPAKLPIGCVFTDFRVFDFGNGSEIRLYAQDPYIDFRVEIAISRPVVPTQEAELFEYDVFEHDGLYQAVWNYNGDFYTVVVKDKTVLTKIIENLQES